MTPSPPYVLMALAGVRVTILTVYVCTYIARKHSRPPGLSSTTTNRRMLTRKPSSPGGFGDLPEAAETPVCGGGGTIRTWITCSSSVMKQYAISCRTVYLAKRPAFLAAHHVVSCSSVLSVLRFTNGPTLAFRACMAIHIRIFEDVLERYGALLGCIGIDILLSGRDLPVGSFTSNLVSGNDVARPGGDLRCTTRRSSIW